MASRILIIGTGFAGIWSALSAKRLLQLHQKDKDIQISVVSPSPTLVLRPRLYEANPSGMTQDVSQVFAEANIEYIQGFVESIDTTNRVAHLKSKSSAMSTILYDRLVLAAGSSVVRPRSISGIDEHSFDIDSIEAASKLEKHLQALENLPASAARDTIVVCGGGFTGIELATELPSRVGSGKRIILVEGADEIGPELGAGPRPAILKALSKLGVEVKLGSKITAIGTDGVTLSSGEHIDTMTAIWTAGVKASPLTADFPDKKDNLGRVYVDQTLRVPTNEHVFVTGDSAHALTDPAGQVALMSCQHALVLGRVSGHNAAADLIGEPLTDYSQKAYNCCLDLGGQGAVIGKGWEREIMLEGDMAKRVKSYINGTLIYTPKNASEAIVAANPEIPDSDELFRQLLETIQTPA